MVLTRQRGMTFFGWIIFIFNLGFLVWFAITAILIHLEALKVMSIIDGLKQVERITQKTKREIKVIAKKRMMIDYIEATKQEEYINLLNIETKDNKVSIAIAFEVRGNFMFGIILLRKYKHDIEIIAN